MTGSAVHGLAANGKPIESVWDYPRPPRVERVEWRIRVVHAGVTVVDAPHALRVLETSHPPSYYVAAEFVDLDVLAPSPRRSLCEWKGVAEYADLVIADAVVREAAWTYPSPTPEFGGSRRPLGVLRAEARRVLRRRRAGDEQRRQLLRRLGDGQRDRPVQGCPGHQPLVMNVHLSMCISG